MRIDMIKISYTQNLNQGFDEEERGKKKGYI